MEKCGFTSNDDNPEWVLFAGLSLVDTQRFHKFESIPFWENF